MLLVYAYLNYAFFHATRILEANGRGELKRDKDGSFFFELSDKGREVAEHLERERRGESDGPT
jgi:hypothetical protein